jgi:hypothetical protein
MYKSAVPTEDAEPTEKEVFYSLLDSTLTDIHRSDIVLMMGDFNAKVGCDNEDIEYIMGKYGLSQQNENGELLIEICGRHGLVIGGTIFPHKACHKVTWVSPAIGGTIFPHKACHKVTWLSPAIGGTIFPHKACHKVTWVSPAIGGRVQNQIDHICKSKN